MPANFLTEIVFRGVLEVVLYGVFYVVGWLVIPVFTLGQYRAAPWDFRSRGKSGRGSAHRSPRQVSADTTCFIGLVTLVVAATIAYFTWRATGA